MEFSMVYDSDLSLFGGDLLVDLPLADSELYESSVSDGLLSKPSKWSDVTSGISQDVSEDVSLAVRHADPNSLHDLYSETWLDSKMDLLELMCMPDDGYSPSMTIVNISASEDKPLVSLLEPSAHAVQLLKEAADEAADFLDNSKSDSTNDLANTEGMDLLDILCNSMPDGALDIVTSSDILAPVSPEEIENILSSEPASPSSLADDDSILSSYMSSDTSADLSVSSDNTMVSFSVPAEVAVDSDLARLLLSLESNKVDQQPVLIQSQTSVSRAKPYDRKPTREVKVKSPALSKEEKTLDKKLRKKQQNKDAAIRYRQKKRAENEAITGELEELESHNKSLKDTVGQMTGEIQYLKNLLAEVYQARGLKLKSSK